MRKLIAFFLLCASCVFAQVGFEDYGKTDIGYAGGNKVAEAHPVWTTESPEFREGLVREFVPDTCLMQNASEVYMWADRSGSQTVRMSATRNANPQHMYIASGGVISTYPNFTPKITAFSSVASPAIVVAVKFMMRPGYAQTTNEYFLVHNDVGGSNSVWSGSGGSYLWSIVGQLKTNVYWRPVQSTRFQAGIPMVVVCSYDPTTRQTFILDNWHDAQKILPSGVVTGESEYKCNMTNIPLNYNAEGINTSYVNKGVWWWSKPKTLVELKAIRSAILRRPDFVPPTYTPMADIATTSPLFTDNLEVACYGTNFSESGGFIDRVYDMSGNGRDATQTNLLYQPIASNGLVLLGSISAGLVFPSMPRCKTVAFKFQFTTSNPDNGLFKMKTNLLIHYPNNGFEWCQPTADDVSSAGNSEDTFATDRTSYTVIATLDEIRRARLFMMGNYISISNSFTATQTPDLAPTYAGFSVNYTGFIGRMRGIWAWSKSVSVEEMRVIKKCIDDLP